MTTTETDDYIAIRRLQNRYADTCSRQAWDEPHQQMLPDASVTLDLPERRLVVEGALPRAGASLDVAMSHWHGHRVGRRHGSKRARMA